MTQHNTDNLQGIAALRRMVSATAADPPAAGIKLMMDADDVAAIMPAAVSADTVRDKHRNWTRANGFPAPLPGMSPLCWSGPAILAWLRRPHDDLGPRAPALAFAEGGATELQRKYGGDR